MIELNNKTNAKVYFFKQMNKIKSIILKLMMKKILRKRNKFKKK